MHHQSSEPSELEKQYALVIKEGETLINHIESLLEGSFDSHTSWKDIHMSENIRREENDLHTVFLAHRTYAGNNIDCQLNLTAVMSEDYSQRIGARVSILESQTRTIEALMKTCTDIVYIHRGEVSAMRSNLLSILAIFTAVLVFLALKI